jgi:hypothetical protein
MKEFPVLWSKSLKFEQRQRGMFSVTDGEEEIVKLWRDVWRKVWFALSAMSKMSNNMLIDAWNGWMHFCNTKTSKKLAKLKDFLSKTNCHWTSRLLTSSTWEHPYKWWSSTSSFIRRDSQNIWYLREVLDREWAPLVIYSEVKNHSLIILGYSQKDWKYIIFEKIWFNFPFKLSVVSDEDLKDFDQYMPSDNK